MSRSRLPMACCLWLHVSAIFVNNLLSKVACSFQTPFTCFHSKRDSSIHCCCPCSLNFAQLTCSSSRIIIVSLLKESQVIIIVSLLKESQVLMEWLEENLKSSILLLLLLLFFFSNIYVNYFFIQFDIIVGSISKIELETSCTRSENHTTRPNALVVRVKGVMPLKLGSMLYQNSAIENKWYYHHLLLQDFLKPSWNNLKVISFPRLEENLTYTILYSSINML